MLANSDSDGNASQYDWQNRIVQLAEQKLPVLVTSANMLLGILSKFYRISSGCSYWPPPGGSLLSSVGSQAKRTACKKTTARKKQLLVTSAGMSFGILSKFRRTTSCPYLPLLGRPLRSSAGTQSARTIFGKKPPPEPTCPPDEACEGEFPNRLWSLFKRKKVEKVLNPDGPEFCRPEGVCPPPDPDLSFLKGKKYRTCGTAYVVEQQQFPEWVHEPTAEDRALAKIEAAIGRKHIAVNPVPAFRNVEQRMMDLDRLRLHPCHRRFRNVVKRRQASDRYEPFEIPAQLKINRRLLDAKNRIVQYKRIHPPAGYPLSPTKVKTYRRPCQVPVIPTDSVEVPKNTAVFDTLYQMKMAI